jgi:hypothetical protein
VLERVRRARQEIDRAQPGADQGRSERGAVTTARAEQPREQRGRDDHPGKVAELAGPARGQQPAALEHVIVQREQRERPPPQRVRKGAGQS